MRNKTRLYLAEDAYKRKWIINSPNHLPYNSVHTAFYVPHQ